MKLDHFFLGRLLRDLLTLVEPIASLVPLPKLRRSAINRRLTERNLLATDAVAQSMEENPALFQHAPFCAQDLRADLAAASLYRTFRGVFLDLAERADAGYCQSLLRAHDRALPLVQDATIQVGLTYQSPAEKAVARARYDALEMARYHLDKQKQKQGKGIKAALARKKALLK